MQLCRYMVGHGVNKLVSGVSLPEWLQVKIVVPRWDGLNDVMKVYFSLVYFWKSIFEWYSSTFFKVFSSSGSLSFNSNLKSDMVIWQFQIWRSFKAFMLVLFTYIFSVTRRYRSDEWYWLSHWSLALTLLMWPGLSVLYRDILRKQYIASFKTIRKYRDTRGYHDIFYAWY